MRKNVIIIENFYKDPDLIRDYALKQRYYYPYDSDVDVKAGRIKFHWMTSWFKMPSECPFKGSPDLVRTLEHITGDHIDLDHWNRSFPLATDGKAASDCRQFSRTCLWNCCFHLKPDTGQQLGDGVHNHVTDTWNSVGANGWTGLIYLNSDAPLEGGLKLWRNVDPTRTYDWMTPKENWEMVDDLGNMYNRLILCRGNLPHSGAAGWGNTLHTGRLYQTFFFQVKDPVIPQSLSISLKAAQARP